MFLSHIDCLLYHDEVNRPILLDMLISAIRYSQYKAIDMLKPRIIATEMLKRRVQEKTKKPSSPLNIADITILGNHHLGFKPDIIVNSEGNVYMFNCSSGTQRLSFMSKIRLYKVENVFITNRTWENVSGVFGLSLTLQDMGSPVLNVNSTEGIEGLFEASRNFMFFNTGMVCNAQKAREYKDHGMSILPIHIETCARKAESLDADNSKRAKLTPKLVSYLCTLPNLPGALDPQKCKDLKVPVGPLLGKLKSGLDVTLPDGSIVRSVDVCSPRERGLNFLIVECPETSSLEQFTTNQQLDANRNLRLQKDGRQVDFVIHLSPPDIVQSPNYQRWMQGFADSCKHFLASNSDARVANFIECYRFQYLLNQLDDKIFPLLYLPENLRQKPIEELKCQTFTERLPSHIDEIDDVINPDFRMVGDFEQLGSVTTLNSLDKISIRPKKMLETLDAENSLDILYREAQQNPHFQEELEKLRSLQSTLPKAEDHEPELVFLGTGSAIPNKLRNTSGILINFKFPRHSSVIMDCGEDSYGQLLRHYGPDDTARILKQLDLIYVSHHHTDHHVGMIDLLRHRRKFTNRRITLLLPPSLDNLIQFHDNNFQDLRDTYKVYRNKHIKSKPLMGPDIATTLSIKQTIYDDLDGLVGRIDVVDVDHCANACAAVFEFNVNHPKMKKFTVAYSGDARPSRDFAMIGKDCDLLIHEATFDDRSKPDALTKKHCTSAEAIQMGKKMNAKFTIITHYSQRIPKIPYFTEDFDDQVGFAFDNLSLRCPTHFLRMPLMKSMLSLIFKKSLDEIDLRYLKQELRSKAIDEALKLK